MRRIAALAAAALVAGGLTTGTATATSGAADPPLTVSGTDLAAAFHCPATFANTREPVLLVHGTFANDQENYSWNYLLDLPERGFDVCTVTLPHRSQADIQVASEYVVFAVRQMAAATGRRVDILGHSQGGLQPRWAVRWYRHLRPLVDDIVTLATPHHGTELASLQAQSCAACFQMSPNSRFLARLNSGDETPSAIDYTSIWTELVDELVFPEPEASTLGGGGSNVANIPVQSVCASRPVDHVSIVADAVVHQLVLDAFTEDGPADVARAAPNCLSTTFVPPEALAAGLALLEDALTDPEPPVGEGRADAEPATAFYARTGLPTFVDVPRRHSAFWEVEWTDATGVTQVERRRFRPGDPWTQGQAVRWLSRIGIERGPAPHPDRPMRRAQAARWAGLTDHPWLTVRPHAIVRRGPAAVFVFDVEAASP
jgi:hypothetical protein